MLLRKHLRPKYMYIILESSFLVRLGTFVLTRCSLQYLNIRAISDRGGVSVWGGWVTCSAKNAKQNISA